MTHPLAQHLQDQDIRWVRILWCDNANVTRGKAFHVSFLEEHEQYGIGITQAQQAIPVMFDSVVAASGLGPVGEVWLTPDWSTLVALPYAPGQARVMGNLVSQGAAWDLCPRAFLRGAIAQAAARGFQVRAAFEHEFYLLRQIEGTVQPADQTGFAATLSMDLHQAVIGDIVEALIAQKIPVERYYPESGPGQQEIAIRYTDALQAADWAVMFRETVKAIALRHHLHASFLPKLFADAAGSGCHLHLSLWQAGQNLMPDAEGLGGLSAPALGFIAGILDHLPGLMAVTTPSSNSYRRLQPHFWSGAFRCWGLDNREAAVRVPSRPVGPPNRIELKTVDASANPYLALGMAIYAGLDGIHRNLHPGPPLQADPGNLPEADRQQRGIDRLPATLGEAIARFTQSPTLFQAFPPAQAQAFVAVRQAEWAYFQDLDLETEVKLLLERY